jgi:hypothetical protein
VVEEVPRNQSRNSQHFNNQIGKVTSLSIEITTFTQMRSSYLTMDSDASCTKSWKTAGRYTRINLKTDLHWTSRGKESKHSKEKAKMQTVLTTSTFCLTSQKSKRLAKSATMDLAKRLISKRQPNRRYLTSFRKGRGTKGVYKTCEDRKDRCQCEVRF